MRHQSHCRKVILSLTVVSPRTLEPKACSWGCAIVVIRNCASNFGFTVFPRHSPCNTSQTIYQYIQTSKPAPIGCVVGLRDVLPSQASTTVAKPRSLVDTDLPVFFICTNLCRRNRYQAGMRCMGRGEHVVCHSADTTTCSAWLLKQCV
jgi:hypothetical protein